MLPIMAIAGLVSQFAPAAIGLFSPGKGESAAKAANIASGIIESITGKSGDEAIQQIQGSPELQLEFKKALMADSHIDEQMRYADRADARNMYKAHHEMQDKIAATIMGVNLWFVLGLVAINVAITVFSPVELMGVVSGASTLIGMIINSLLKERQDVVGFSFGSSMGSKTKDLK